YFVVDEDRRCAEAVEHVERAKRKLPTLLAVRVVGKQAELLEEHVDVLAIGDRARRRGAIDELQPARLLARHLALPEYLSSLPVKAEDEQLVVRLLGGVSGYEDAIASQHRRRMPGRKCGLPHDVLVRSELRRQA